jgi:RNA polymerase sigma factor (sigma-70 family)
MDDDRLFAELAGDLRRLARAVRPPDVDADDLVQEALVRALRRGPLCELDQPAAYLARAVVNLARDHRRSFSRRRRLAPLVARSASATEDDYPSDLADLLAVDPGDRAVLWLRVVEGRSHAEVAAILDITPGASRTRLSRALARLRVEAPDLEEADADHR